jgi:hypothetical protein
MFYGHNALLILNMHLFQFGTIFKKNVIMFTHNNYNVYIKIGPSLETEPLPRGSYNFTILDEAFLLSTTMRLVFITNVQSREEQF